MSEQSSTPQAPVFGPARLTVSVMVAVEVEVRNGRAYAVTVSNGSLPVRVFDERAATELSAEEVTNLVTASDHLDPYGRWVTDAIRIAERVASEPEFVREVGRAAKASLARSA